MTTGGDRIDAGAGDDIIEIGDLGFRSLTGGAGFDRIVLAIGADSLDLAAVHATGRLNDIEAIEMQGLQRLVLRAGDILDLSGENALRLLTTGSDRVELIGAWTELAAVQVDGATWRRFVNGGETALVAGTGAVTVAAAPSAAAGSLDAIASGTVAPLPGSVPGAVLSDTTTVLNNYLLHATETVQAHETWRSDDGQPILWTGADYSLINYGLMESIGPGNGGAKVIYLQDIDLIENHGTMRAQASGGEYADVIYGTGGSGGLANYGLIEAVTDGGGATGVTIGDRIFAELAFLNEGTISARSSTGSATGVQIARAVPSQEFPNAINAGTIEAAGGAGTVGLKLAADGRFLNEGTIEARNSAASGAADATAVWFTWYSSGGFGPTSRFDNSGTIRGITAIRSDFGTVELVNSGRIEGIIALAEGGDLVENRGAIVGLIGLGSGNDQ